jgi:hypothetical protein
MAIIIEVHTYVKVFYIVPNKSTNFVEDLPTLQHSCHICFQMVARLKEVKECVVFQIGFWNSSINWRCLARFILPGHIVHMSFYIHCFCQLYLMNFSKKIFKFIKINLGFSLPSESPVLHVDNFMYWRISKSYLKNYTFFHSFFSSFIDFLICNNYQKNWKYLQNSKQSTAIIT